MALLFVFGIVAHRGLLSCRGGRFFGLLGQLLANLLMQAFQLPSAEPYIGRAEEHMVLATLTDYSHVIFLTHLHLRNMLL